MSLAIKKSLSTKAYQNSSISSYTLSQPLSIEWLLFINQSNTQHKPENQIRSEITVYLSICCDLLQKPVTQLNKALRFDIGDAGDNGYGS